MHIHKAFIMDDFYADDVEAMINVARTISPRFKAMDNRDIVSILMEMGLTLEELRHSTPKK